MEHSWPVVNMDGLGSAHCFPQVSVFQTGKIKAEHVKLRYLVKSSVELQPSDGVRRGLSLSTNGLAALHSPLQSAHGELQSTGPVTKQKILG